jgi:uncharacterized membrane protein/protein-disulfide isomerase
MTARARYALIAFSALALIASSAALYVHYRLLTDPTYSSFCDVNEAVSCTQVFQSEYGSMFGVPVAAGGAIWSLLVLLLSWGLRTAKADMAPRVAGYIFVLSTLGLATVFYFGYVSFFILKSACPLCITMYVGVIGTVLVSASVAGPMTSLPSRLGEDIAALFKSPAAATLAAVWAVVTVGLLVAFPKEPTFTQTASDGSTQSSVPVETLSPEQRAEWEAWLDAQPRKPEALPTGATKVLVLKFNDYQCPSCRMAWILYKDIIAKYEKSSPGVFVFENRDYPLETECGAGNAGHVAACEAAAAVRMARGKNKDKDLETALFEQQSPSMTRDEVKATLEKVAQISSTEFDAQYPKMLESIRSDVQLGQKLGVTGTPTFFLNGIQLPSLRPAYFDAAMEWALKRSSSTS